MKQEHEKNSSRRHFSSRPWLSMSEKAQLMYGIRVNVNITYLVGREIKPGAIVVVGQKRSRWSKGKAAKIPLP